MRWCTGKFEEKEERDEDSARMQGGKGEMEIDISKQKRYDIGGRGEERKHAGIRGEWSGITIWKVVQDMVSVTFGELQNITVGLCPHHTSTWYIVDEVHLQETHEEFYILCTYLGT